MSSLSHLKVIDLTNHLAGPYCAMILADHGADVIKIENPNGGDQLRQTPPFQEGESAPFMLWNRNIIQDWILALGSPASGLPLLLIMK